MSKRAALLFLARYSLGSGAFQPIFGTVAAKNTSNGGSLNMAPKRKSLWTPADESQAKEARSKLDVWPLDEYNALLLNQVHPIDYPAPKEIPEEYDLVVIGAGAGGLVSSKQVRYDDCGNDACRWLFPV